MSEEVSLTATADMLCRARSGDEQARCDLVQRYREPLARFLHARLALSSRGVHAERLLAIEDALQRLPGAERDAVLLRLEVDLPYEVIARECGYPSADAARMAILE